VGSEVGDGVGLAVGEGVGTWLGTLVGEDKNEMSSIATSDLPTPVWFTFA
jgi:hypothetical protein